MLYPTLWLTQLMVKRTSASWVRTEDVILDLFLVFCQWSQLRFGHFSDSGRPLSEAAKVRLQPDNKDLRD